MTVILPLIFLWKLMFNRLKLKIFNVLVVLFFMFFMLNMSYFLTYWFSIIIIFTAPVYLLITFRMACLIVSCLPCCMCCYCCIKKVCNQQQSYEAYDWRSDPQNVYGRRQNIPLAETQPLNRSANVYSTHVAASQQYITHRLLLFSLRRRLKIQVCVSVTMNFHRHRMT